MTINTLLGKIATYIINPVIVLGFVIATIYLFYAIIVMMAKADSGDLSKNRMNVLYGILGMFIMFSAYGILHIVMNTLGITCSGFFFCN